MFQYIQCPKCKRKIKAILRENRWVRWIDIYCSDCGYRELIKDKEFDFIQPSSPFFRAIYKDDPIALEQRNKRERLIKDGNLKDNRDVELKLKIKQGLLKPWEVKDIKKYTREHNLE